MKKILSLLVITCIVGLSSCKKTSTTLTSFPLIGSWTGSWKQTAPPASGFYSFNFQVSPNNLNLVGIIEQNGNNFESSNTTYTNSDSIRFTYTIGNPARTVIVACKYISTSGTINGTYYNPSLAGDAGTLTLNRQ